MPKFSERLRFLRVTKDLSQAEFAKLVGISKSSVNMYERGEREPGLVTLERIADYFNVDMDYLLGKSDVMRRYSFDHIVYVNSDSHETINYSVPNNGLILSDDECDFLSKFRMLDDRGKASVRNILDHEFNSLPGKKANSASKEA